MISCCSGFALLLLGLCLPLLLSRSRDDTTEITCPGRAEVKVVAMNVTLTTMEMSDVDFQLLHTWNSAGACTSCLCLLLYCYGTPLKSLFTPQAKLLDRKGGRALV
jgi:hypothetical protein